MEKNQKITEISGLLWGGAFFIGILTALILGLKEVFDWLPSLLIGILVFMALGLISQAIVTIKK